MKYIEYIAIVLFIPIRHIFGRVWIYFAIPFRKYARNTVYNYVLANGVYLQRLLERPIVDMGDEYIIQPYHKTNGGYITKRKVSWLEYKLVYWIIWGWLDDDSNEDTYSYGHMTRHYKWWKKEKPYYGNSFDLGDKRAEYPSFDLIATTIWTWRNTAFNFEYMQWQISEEEWSTGKYFYVELFGMPFGWIPYTSDNVEKRGQLRCGLK